MQAYLLDTALPGDTYLSALWTHDFPVNGGTIQIGSEQINYTSVSDIGFYGCTRGVNGTTAAGHLSKSAISFIPPTLGPGTYFTAPNGNVWVIAFDNSGNLNKLRIS